MKTLYVNISREQSTEQTYNICLKWNKDNPEAFKRRWSMRPIQKAMDYHLEKYGSTPTLAEVHPSMLEEVNIIVLRPSRYVLPGNIWIGVEDVKN
jgi:hypothetical protein